ncbi:universal stress protein [Saccharopolyspora flava]|uniref:Nucleotide-binding universal stress protein, UspA family n=1 Tax=Saccharopolyspora flava TaxID=95161 RepID=A0A1I6UCT2_9PSEU|nr:universal stress protein [Saccharopolyspora flava]SFS99242.1 Nucleotide-binding universal stress protein, UspA family [Saccharopolyspora flava]
MAERGRFPVLVGFDGSEASREAVRWAAREASSRGCPLVLMHVLARPFQHSLPMRIPDEHDVMTKLSNAVLEQLEALEDECRKIDPDLQVSKDMPIGDAAEVLVERAGDAALVVLGGPLVGSRTDRLGVTAAEVVARRAAAPIVVVRGQAGTRPDSPVVVGVDGSAVSERAIGFAYETAARLDRPLVGVHSWGETAFNPFDIVDEWDADRSEFRDRAREILSESMAGWADRYPDVQVRHVVGPEQPATLLLGETDGATLLVVGSHGRGAVRRTFMGSVSHAVLNQAPCPVAVLPAE